MALWLLQQDKIVMVTLCSLVMLQLMRDLVWVEEVLLRQQSVKPFERLLHSEDLDDKNKM
jgi:hypothetical protein